MFSPEVAEKAANWWCIKILDNMDYMKREYENTMRMVKSAIATSEDGSVPFYIDNLYKCECGHKLGYMHRESRCPICGTKVLNIFDRCLKLKNKVTISKLTDFRHQIVINLITYDDDDEIKFGVNLKPFGILETIVTDLNIPYTILPQKTFMKIVGDEIQIHVEEGPYIILK